MSEAPPDSAAEVIQSPENRIFERLFGNIKEWQDELLAHIDYIDKLLPLIRDNLTQGIIHNPRLCKTPEGQVLKLILDPFEDPIYFFPEIDPERENDEDYDPYSIVDGTIFAKDHPEQAFGWVVPENKDNLDADLSKRTQEAHALWERITAAHCANLAESMLKKRYEVIRWIKTRIERRDSQLLEEITGRMRIIREQITSNPAEIMGIMADFSDSRIAKVEIPQKLIHQYNPDYNKHDNSILHELLGSLAHMAPPETMPMDEKGRDISNKYAIYINKFTMLYALGLALDRAVGEIENLYAN